LDSLIVASYSYRVHSYPDLIIVGYLVGKSTGGTFYRLNAKANNELNPNTSRMAS